MKLKDISEIRFCLTSISKSDELTSDKVIMPSNLFENNVISNMSDNNFIKVDKSAVISCGDIIVKRINPLFVNYVEDIEEKTYASSNLIIVKTNKMNPKYLAYVLNKMINKVVSSLSGATTLAIGRNDLEEIDIPVLPLNQQEIIGEVWIKNIELKKLKIKLSELEYIRTNYYLNKYMLH